MLCKKKVNYVAEDSIVYLKDVVLSTSEGVDRGKLIFLKAPVLFSFRYRKDSVGSSKTLSEESKLTVISVIRILSYQ